MAGYGPPEDPSRQPTRRAEVNARGYRPPGPPPSPPGEPAPPTGSYPVVNAAQPPAPTPWYRKRVVLIAWGLLVLALIALIIYGLFDLAGRGNGGPTPTPTTTTTPTTATTTATTPTTTSPSPSSTTEESEEPPPSSEPPRAPAPPAPPPAGTAPPSHRHHLPKLPPTITVPGGPVITLPPHL